MGILSPGGDLLRTEEVPVESIVSAAWGGRGTQSAGVWPSRDICSGKGGSCSGNQKSESGRGTTCFRGKWREGFRSKVKHAYGSTPFEKTAEESFGRREGSKSSRKSEFEADRKKEGKRGRHKGRRVFRWF